MAPGNRNDPQRAASSDLAYTLLEFMADFRDDETCLRWLWNTRYNLGGDTAHCERCGDIRPFKRYVGKQQRQDWTCTACGLHVHPTAGTIYHKSSTDLHLWFYAMYLMTSTRCGISAKQLERELGVTYKTAWRMFNLIRNELAVQPSRRRPRDVRGVTLPLRLSPRQQGVRAPVAWQPSPGHGTRPSWPESESPLPLASPVSARRRSISP